MEKQLQSPQIERLAWGEIELAGGRRFKDLKVWPGGAREWDWRETGTHHVPGILPRDVEELLQRGVTEVVFGCGHLKRLQVDDATLRLLAERKIPIHAYSTRKAVQLYNDLCSKKRVGGLFHSTC
ncbi:MAG: MTH938/NDUFAF3 family protein [Lentisphaeria bacterium]|nr:MTH938/NDUFAF3 family protein [Candidatus Neomarinimicrobiota bacterium]MCF7841766.1 MTH938/NDUFAF3 family protein [Lentisphaeria bacterium]